MADKRRPFRPSFGEPMPPGMNCKPWYNDRLPSKCLAKHKNKMMKFPTSLDGRRWIFVKEEQDDFRKGYPPCKGFITRGAKEAFLPTISHHVSHPAPRKSRKKLSKDESQFSTLSETQRKRQAFVKDAEAQIKHHPLALYPTLEEDVPSDILAKALKVLDPGRKMERSRAYGEGNSEGTEELSNVGKPCRQTKDVLKLPKIPGTHRKQSFQEENSSKMPECPPPKAVPKGIRDFCDWVATFGDLGIDEEFMKQQVEVGFECTPRYEDYHKKRINMLPSEIKTCTKLSKVKEIRFSLQETNFERKLWKPPNPYKPEWMKIRYGAWYLKPKLWRKLVNNEPLIDPKILLEIEASMNPPPDVIDDLYGVIAFKDFIVSKGYDMPDILERLFMRKGWDYDVVKTPIPRAIKAHAIIDDDDDDDDY